MAGLESIASVVTITDATLGIYHTISKFFQNAREADNTVRELYCKLQRLSETLRLISVTLHHRHGQLEGREVQPEEQLYLVYISISDTLKESRRTLEKFQKEVGPLQERLEGHAKPSQMDKAILQYKLNQRARVIAELKDAIKTNHDELSLRLSCLKL